MEKLVFYDMLIDRVYYSVPKSTSIPDFDHGGHLLLALGIYRKGINLTDHLVYSALYHMAKKIYPNTFGEVYQTMKTYYLELKKLGIILVWSKEEPVGNEVVHELKVID